MGILISEWTFLQGYIFFPSSLSAKIPSFSCRAPVAIGTGVDDAPGTVDASTFESAVWALASSMPVFADSVSRKPIKNFCRAGYSDSFVVERTLYNDENKTMEAGEVKSSRFRLLNDASTPFNEDAWSCVERLDSHSMSESSDQLAHFFWAVSWKYLKIRVE